MSGQNKRYKDDTGQKLKEKKQERTTVIRCNLQEFFEKYIKEEIILKNGKLSNKDN